MNYRIVARFLGFFSIAVGLLMLPSALWAVYFTEWTALGALLLSALASVVTGIVLTLAGHNAEEQFYQREALGLVGFSWGVAAVLGALPFVLAGVLTPLDALFESMSGFTTTGASVFTAGHFATTPRSIVFWRSFTHWLGGMGIIVLFLAVLPYLGAGGKQMFRSESPGPDPRGLKPRIQDTAKILYTIYLGFTAVQTLLLMLAGMSFYEALCHTFGTLATGGFSPRPESIAAYDSTLIHVIIIFFMICAGTNFGLYFGLLRRDWHALFSDSEWRVYVGFLALCTAAVALNLLLGGAGPSGSPLYDSPALATRDAAFQVVSIMTTTGYATADFDQWPYFSRMVLVILMFVGGCAGSTGGGIKVARVVMLAKMAYWRLESTFRPKTIRAIRISGTVIDESVQRMTYGFFVLFVFIFAAGSVFMSLLGLPFESAVTSVAATLNNIGPGLEAVGPVMNYAEVPAAGKAFLTFCMVLGRLELFSILVLLTPAFWRHS